MHPHPDPLPEHREREKGCMHIDSPLVSCSQQPIPARRVSVDEGPSGPFDPNTGDPMTRRLRALPASCLAAPLSSPALVSAKDAPAAAPPAAPPAVKKADAPRNQAKEPAD